MAREREDNSVLDESSLYGGLEEPLEERLRPTFAEVMREIQSASGKRLTWQQMSTITLISRSALRKIVKGELAPPRSLEFIERVRRLPGVTNDHIERLLQVADASNWLALASHHFREGEESEHTAEILAAGGINVFLGVRLDSNQYSKAELNELTGHIRRQVGGTIQMFRDFRKTGKNATEESSL